MRKLHKILRMHFSSGASIREIATATDVGYGTVANYLKAARQAGLSWPLPEKWGERELGRALFPTQPAGQSQRRFARPDFAQIHVELRSPGMTKLLAWEEYRAIHPEHGYSYSQFCHRYNAWLDRQKRSMRQRHVAGEKCFVDYCGPTVPIVCAETGEYQNAQIFVAVLGASNYTFAHASLSQTEADWINSHVKAAEFFGGWATLTIPDNLKSGVTKVHRYTPVLNASYERWSEWYDTAIIPARPYKPKDKAKAENAVLVVERWILARLRKYTFFSLGELNKAIAELLVDLNNRAFKKLPGSRRSLFEQLDQPALKPLPAEPYEYLFVKSARVHIDYHIEFDKHYYSVPHSLVKTAVEVRASSTLVSIYAHGKRAACHVRSAFQGGHTTLPEHMPQSHRAMSQWSSERFEQWASDIGQATAQVVKHQLQTKRHPEQSYRSVMALLDLAKQYDSVRLEAACQRAIDIGSLTRTSVKSILKNGLDTQLNNTAPIQLDAEDDHLLEHDNIRGSNYFH